VARTPERDQRYNEGSSCDLTSEVIPMLTCVEGAYREGRVDLLETPAGVHQARVIVTFLPAELTPPSRPDLTCGEAAELRWKLSAWEEDWNAPGMEAYDEL